MNTSKTSTWFEVKIKYDKVMDDGLMKSVREAYTVEAMSFTEAEAVITKEMTPYMSGLWLRKRLLLIRMCSSPKTRKTILSTR